MFEHKHNVLDNTTWEFGKTGWWVSHIVTIGAAIYLGSVLKRAIEKKFNEMQEY